MNKEFEAWLEGYLEDKLTPEQLERVKFKLGEAKFKDSINTTFPNLNTGYIRCQCGKLGVCDCGWNSSINYK